MVQGASHRGDEEGETKRWGRHPSAVIPIAPESGDPLTLGELLCSQQPLRRIAEGDAPLTVRAIALLLVGDEAGSRTLLERAGPRTAELREARCIVHLERGAPATAVAALGEAVTPLAHALAAEAGFQLGQDRMAKRRLELAGAQPLATLVAGRQQRGSRLLWAMERLQRSGGLIGARAQLEAARMLLTVGDEPAVAKARSKVSAAAWGLIRLGVMGDVGRCYLLMAAIEALDGTDDTRRERVAPWLARAAPLIEAVGTPDDREHLRRAFRRHGRRALDGIVTGPLEQVIEHALESQARITDLLGARFLEPQSQEKSASMLDAAVEASGTAVEELIRSVEALLLKRHRLDQLVEVSQELLAARTTRTLDGLAAPLLANLGIIGATIIRVDEAPPHRVSSAGRPISLEDVPITAALRGRTLVRSESDETILAMGIGRLRKMVIAVRRPSTERRSEAATNELIEVAASMLEAGYERAAQAEIAAEAARRDAATLEAIDHGVLTLDDAGRIRTSNTAARALLRLDQNDYTAALCDLPHLGPLAEAIEANAEDEVVALAHIELLVRSKCYEGGTVVTLRELGKARRLAHRLVGHQARFTFDDLLGTAPSFVEARDGARRVAPTDAPVLITGESGTGKELLAQAIHCASPRASLPFVAVNVAAIPRELLESELFGHVPGAFTGAHSKGRPGRFELADGGTVLLDEIGDMPLEMQAKLLRVLEEGSVTRLGSNERTPMRARIIASTHRDLHQLVDEGSFRLDLFYRLRVVHLRLPPLRSRHGDIELLTHSFVQRHCRRLGRSPVRLAPELLQAMADYDWPGNVRELANIVEGALTLLPTDVEVWSELPEALRVPRVSRDLISADHLPTLAELERFAIRRALDDTGGNVTQAAQRLGISRQTLYNRMSKHGLR